MTKDDQIYAVQEDDPFRGTIGYVIHKPTGIRMYIDKFEWEIA